MASALPTAAAAAAAAITKMPLRPNGTKVLYGLGTLNPASSLRYPQRVATSHRTLFNQASSLINTSKTSASRYPQTVPVTSLGTTYTYHKQQQQQQQQVRYSSHSPLGNKDGTTSSRKKVTLQTLLGMYKRDEPITMITAHDFPSAHVADHAGMDMVLVGDSLAMVALGLEDTSEVLLDEMLLHCRSVSRGAQHAFIVGDLSMGSYEISPEQAMQSAIRVIKEGRVHAVKLEGGAEMAPTIARITAAGIPVLAHIGLTPQRQNALGGFRVQGKSVKGALKVLEDALAVQAAGAFGVVLEAVPQEVATFITKKLQIPTIGIGAGNGTSGQVLVQVDMSGYYPPGRFLPRFVKKFGDIWSESLRALETYGKEVRSREYPAAEHTYPMPKEQLTEFQKLVESSGGDK